MHTLNNINLSSKVSIILANTYVLKLSGLTSNNTSFTSLLCYSKAGYVSYTSTINILVCVSIIFHVLQLRLVKVLSFII